MKPIIHVANVSKRYRIGAIQNAPITFRETLAETVRAPLRMVRRSGISADETFWALRDVSFEIEPGEVVGIIGANGAGKSTLLKILSRITDPTDGRIELFGRVGSLLEIGTGFHPELTGRENIYLNGSILGMDRKEIERKFDEIVGFSEIGKFIDTPVKRYSSGMYVRLAFAVAAHLEPEILLVDEVLAVGDVAFQKKCLGKMGDVAREGRTVVYVSHHLQSIKSLCPRTILIDGGRIKMDGPTDQTLVAYTGVLRKPKLITNAGLKNRMQRTSGTVRFTDVSALDENGNRAWEFRVGSTIRLRLSYEVFQDVPSLGIYMALRSTITNEIITTVKDVVSTAPLPAGRTSAITLEFPNSLLRPGDYSLYICLGNKDCEKFFDVVDENIDLPWLGILSDEKDPHRTQGYFSMASRILAE